MPPEQINGRLVDERCDVFSLAVVCWQALTGENPFSAGTAEKSLEKIERGPRQDISKLSDDLTDEAAQAITQAMLIFYHTQLFDLDDLAIFEV